MKPGEGRGCDGERERASSKQTFLITHACIAPGRVWEGVRVEIYFVDRAEQAERQNKDRYVIYLHLFYYYFAPATRTLYLLYNYVRNQRHIFEHSKYRTPLAKLPHFKSFKALDLFEYIRRICGVYSQFSSSNPPRDTLISQAATGSIRIQSRAG